MRLTDMATWHTRALIALLAMGLLLSPAAERRLSAAPVDCTIRESAGIGAVRLGMGADAALAITGNPLRQRTSASQVTYTLRPPWSQMIAEYGVVRRVSTSTATCRTTHGIGPGSPLAAVREAYASANVSSIQPLQDGSLLTYPFVGVAFLLYSERVTIVEVFRAEGAAGAAAAAATPGPPRGSPGGATPRPAASPTTAPGSWSVRSTSIKVEANGVVVSGSIENRSRALAAFAEVRAFDGSGRLIGQGNAPLSPTLVPGGGTASFEIRLAVDGIVRRYTVLIRPTDRANEILAQATGEVKDADLKQFGPIVAQQLQVTVQSTAPVPTPNSFIVVVANPTTLAVASATIDVEVTVTCRIGAAGGAPRTIEERWTGTATVQQVSAGGSGRAPVALSGGVCLDFTSWSARTRVGDVTIAQ